jgi:ubiquinone/menaquinone biosynthesis C-methylase UbiE
MIRTQEEFIEKTDPIVQFSGKAVLEIGCGNGHYTKQLARVAGSVTAIDPDVESIGIVIRQNVEDSVYYKLGSAVVLDFQDESFDIVVFTLSLHHVPDLEMITAINEAIRVVKENGYIIFLEPATDGTFFEAELIFDACDGDERKEKELAYKAIISHPHLEHIRELDDRTVFEFDSVEDFIQVLQPKINTEQLLDFLADHNFALEAKRRINVCKLIKK